MAKIVDLGKIKVGKLYVTPNDDIVRVVRINAVHNSAAIYNYHSHINQSVNLDVAAENFIQVFKLADAARAIGKRPATIRTYEAKGLVEKAKKIATNPDGKALTRIYSVEDIESLRLFFEKRRPVGRPRFDRSKKYSKEEVKNKLDQIKIGEVEWQI